MGSATGDMPLTPFFEDDATGSAPGSQYSETPAIKAGRLPESVPARYPGWHAVIGELHFRLGQHTAAERAWREALRFTSARADQEFLRRRLAVCRPEVGKPATESGQRKGKKTQTTLASEQVLDGDCSCGSSA